MRKIALAFIMVHALARGAAAQGLNIMPITALVGASSGLIGTSAVLIIPEMVGGGSLNASNYSGVPASWTYASIANDSTTATLTCGYSPSITAGGIGGKPIPPGQSIWWDATFPPPKNQPFYCVSTAANTPFDAEVGSN